MIIDIVDIHHTTTIRVPRSQEALDWTSRHTNVARARAARLMSRLDAGGAVRTILRTRRGRPHMTVIDSGVIVTCWLDEPGSLEAWRADGTVPVMTTMSVIVPACFGWEIGRAGVVYRGSYDTAGVSITPLSSNNVQGAWVSQDVPMGWRCLADQGPFPEMAMRCRCDGIDGLFRFGSGAWR